MNCPKCGTNVDDRASFCPVCGTPTVIREENGVKTLKSTKYISGGDVTSHALTNLPSGSCICAYVKAYTQAGEEKLVSPAYTGKRVYTKLPAVTGLKGKTSDDKSITISWNTQSGVDGYKIYRYNTSAKKWVGVRTLIGSKLPEGRLNPAIFNTDAPFSSAPEDAFRTTGENRLTDAEGTAEAAAPSRINLTNQMASDHPGRFTVYGPEDIDA